MNAILDIERPAAQAAPSHADAAADPDSGATREVLSFRLGAEEYGIDILRVQEIRSFEPPTRIANAPHHVLGVLNLRGVIVPIVDLRLKFGQSEATRDGNTVTIVLNIAQRVVGMVVDSVSDVQQLGARQVRAAPAFNGAVDASFISGIGTLETAGQPRMLILVDIERLMRSPDMGLVDVDSAAFAH